MNILLILDMYIQTDIDECATDNGRCQQTCNNTDGSHFCSCSTGYMLNSDQLACDDIDECVITNPCPSTCVNTNGSYRCTEAEDSEGLSGGVIAVIVIVPILVVTVVLVVIAGLVYIKYIKNRGKVDVMAVSSDKSGKK